MLRQSPMTHRIPVMIFTASKSEQDRDRAYKNGATMYVVKPDQPQNYRRQISRMVETWKKCFETRN